MKIDDLLADYRDDGTIDSEGTFTLDRTVAAEKLLRYQLSQPHDYSRLLVACAVSARAGECRLESGARTVRFWMDRPLPAGSIAELLTRAPERPLSHLDLLAVALHQARRLGDVKLFTRQDDLTVIHRWDEENHSFHTEKTEYPKGTTFQLQYGAVDASRRLIQRIGTYLPETLPLRRRCGLSPIPTYLGPHTVNTGLGRSAGFVTCRLGNPPEIQHQFRPKADFNLDSPFNGWLFLKTDSSGAHESRLSLVVNGIDFPGRIEDSTAYTEICIWCDDLNLSLDLNGVVRDETFHQILRETKRARLAAADFIGRPTNSENLRGTRDS